MHDVFAVRQGLLIPARRQQLDADRKTGPPALSSVTRGPCFGSTLRSPSKGVFLFKKRKKQKLSLVVMMNTLWSLSEEEEVELAGCNGCLSVQGQYVHDAFAARQGLLTPAACQQVDANRDIGHYQHAAGIDDAAVPRKVLCF